MLVDLSSGIFVTFIIVIFLLVISYKKRKAQQRLDKWSWIRPILGFIAGCALTSIFFGLWGASILQAIFGMLGNPGKIAAVALFMLLVIAVCDLWDGKADKPVVYCAVLIPLVAMSASGWLGAKVNDIRSSVNEKATNVTSTVTGG